jgi:hypothetical protein
MGINLTKYREGVIVAKHNFGKLPSMEYGRIVTVKKNKLKGVVREVNIRWDDNDELVIPYTPEQINELNITVINK